MADQNQNPGSKQADGDGKMEKDSMGGSGGRTGSGVGKAASGDKAAGGAGGQSAGSKNRSVESEDGEDLSGESITGNS